jgi:hypothetical protein
MPHGGDGGGGDGDVALPMRPFHFQSVDASPVIRTSLRRHTENGWNILRRPDREWWRRKRTFPGYGLLQTWMS